MNTFEMVDGHGRVRHVPMTRLRFLRGFSGTLRELGLERMRRALWRLTGRPEDPELERRVSQLIESVRLCPECAYELAGLVPEPDGCTVCPECGAAWRLGPAA